MEWLRFFIVFAAVFIARSAAERVRPPDLFVPVVHAVYPHDPGSYTQGLVWHEGTFYESAGLYDQSNLRQVEPETGEVLRERPLDNRFFAEGLALVGDRLIQITWQEHVAFVYDRDTFEPLGQFEYDTHGWGLCYDGRHLLMTDGTATLFFRDPDTFEVVRTVEVRMAGEPQVYLNELECVDGMVYANIYTTDYIVIIDPNNGRVTGLIYAGNLLTAAERAGTDVLNGIAHNPDTGRFYITGKLWPKLFEVTFEEVQQ